MKKPDTSFTVRNLESKRTALFRMGKPLGRKTTVTRKEAEAWLVDKAESDAAFRRTLVTKPTETIARELGITFPAGIKVRVVQETERELILVLPAPAALDDAELDRVVGGRQKAGEGAEDDKFFKPVGVAQAGNPNNATR